LVAESVEVFDQLEVALERERGVLARTVERSEKDAEAQWPVHGGHGGHVRRVLSAPVVTTVGTVSGWLTFRRPNPREMFRRPRRPERRRLPGTANRATASRLATARLRSGP